MILLQIPKIPYCLLLILWYSIGTKVVWSKCQYNPFRWGLYTTRVLHPSSFMNDENFLTLSKTHFSIFNKTKQYFQNKMFGFISRRERFIMHKSEFLDDHCSGISPENPGMGSTTSIIVYQNIISNPDILSVIFEKFHYQKCCHKTSLWILFEYVCDIFNIIR